jgi:uncharacterized Zn finger protein
MDIYFSCAACGHHMVIDEAGAGMIVECPECGRDTPVPKSNAHTSTLGEAPKTEKERTVVMKWTPPPSPPHSEPKS